MVRGNICIHWWSEKGLPWRRLLHLAVLLAKFRILCCAVLVTLDIGYQWWRWKGFQCLSNGLDDAPVQRKCIIGIPSLFDSVFSKALDQAHIVGMYVGASRFGTAKLENME
jgi:hypothetical protein